MAIPLIILGGAIATYAIGKRMVEDADRIELDRLRHWRDDLPSKQDQDVKKSPSDILAGDVEVILEPGSVVCCGIFGVLQHTGIYVGDNQIVELHGSGLIRAVSFERFLNDRSGKYIFVACNAKGQPLTSLPALNAAAEQVFQYIDYDVLENNCHQFVLNCVHPNSPNVTSFGDFNRYLSEHYDASIYWDKADLSQSY